MGFKLKNIKTVGSVAPSSSFLVNNMLESIDFSKDVHVVEYGVGDGCITKEILKRMSPNSKLISFEINQEFCSKILNEIKDKRFSLEQQSAEDIQEILKKHNIEKVDAVISSLPLAMMPKTVVNNILSQSKQVLKTGSKFVQFQYSFLNYSNLKDTFSSISKRFTLLNLPPAIVFECEE